MFVHQEKRNKACILHLIGPVTVGRGVAALRAVQNDLAKKSGWRLILDLRRVDYLDAAGLGALVCLRNCAASHDAGLVLSGVPDHVREVLGVTLLDGQLEVARNPEEALRRPFSLSGPQPQLI